jgi:predicted O-methyltransferase YrrM
MFNFQIPKRDVKRIVAIGVMLALFYIGGWWVFGEMILVFGGWLLTMGMVFMSLVIYQKLVQLYRNEHQFNRKMHYRTQGQQQQHYKHLESLLSLFCTLKFQAPLPETGDMATLPDFLKKIAELIYQEQPELVVEASSGVSTLVAAYCLKNIGKGRIISLEHDAKYAAISQNLIVAHGLQEIATVVHAPLKEIQINGNMWLWYDIHDVRFEKPIDVLFVDGPPSKIQKLARYPALSVLFDYLSDNAVIFLDDGKRPDEREIVELWSKEFSGLSVEFLPLERGAYLIRRQAR